MTAAACPAPTLVGVGVGPGDPELVTVRAVDVLRRADVVLVPSTSSGGEEAGRAERIVLTACPQAGGRLRRVPFSMSERSGVGPARRRAWEESARAATEAFAAGATTVAFATVGDPSVYSTFSYLAAHVREAVAGLAVAVVPGITAMQALAAASLTPLVEGRETLALVPATAGLDAIEAALDRSDTVVIYKGGSHVTEVLDLVRARGRDGVQGVDVGLPGQELTPLSQVADGRAPYFSTVLVPAVRPTTGGRL